MSCQQIIDINCLAFSVVLYTKTKDKTIHLGSSNSKSIPCATCKQQKHCQFIFLRFYKDLSKHLNH